jgi:putative sugar O-methyltransferase
VDGHCELLEKITDSKPIGEIEVSVFGSPEDVFRINSKNYTISFLNRYIRYCFAQKHIKFNGEETIVELGSGSGYQIEVLKKLYPGLTILCFDLPVQIFLCQKYLTEALDPCEIIGTESTCEWKNLSELKKGGIHFFGNWQFPLLRDFKFDLFWNAASFGEMEPDIVQNYLRFINGNVNWVYLFQARHGKETVGKGVVKTPITLDDYRMYLKGYSLCEIHEAWLSHKKMKASGGYFEAVWKK